MAARGWDCLCYGTRRKGKERVGKEREGRKKSKPIGWLAAVVQCAPSLYLTMCIPSLDSQCNLVQYDDMMGVGGKVQPTKAQPVLDAA